jgi:hypothetical protein
VLYIIKNLTQLERIKTELKRARMEKTRLEDLFMNNYRSQGLAEKKPETQEIVLAKRIKHGVRSV